MPAGIKVFISHQQADGVLAEDIGRRLKLSGLEVYLDTIDRQIDKDGADLADYIRDQLSKCTQLIAVLTNATTRSWWVPWEIGVATEKERFLASYVPSATTVPEYLRKWPYLRSMSDVDSYAKQSIATASTTEIKKRSVITEAARAQLDHNAFRDFHSSLRRTLGQF